MKSDTPKTDAQQEAILWVHDTRRFIVDAQFARTLERELNAERGARERAVEKFDCAEALLQTNSVISARLRAELAQEREWRMSETTASDAMQIRAESAESELAALKLKLEAAKTRDGDWLDKWGVCKVCDGEIPHGHTNACHIYKQEKEITRLKSENEALRAEIQSALEGDPRNHQ